MGDSSSLIQDSGIETWALTANAEGGREPLASRSANNTVEWQPGDAPAEKSIELKRVGGMGVV